MEKMKKALCLLAPFQWSDLGGWVGAAELWPSDAKRNRVYVPKRAPRPLLIKSQENIVRADKRLIALLGVQNLVVVDTPDALLICDRRETERIREIVRELKKRKAGQYL